MLKFTLLSDEHDEPWEVHIDPRAIAGAETTLSSRPVAVIQLFNGEKIAVLDDDLTAVATIRHATKNLPIANCV